MNMESENEPRVMCVIKLHNELKLSNLVADVSEPTLEVTHLPGMNVPVRDWCSRVVVRLNEGVHQKRVWSSSWQASFFLALDYVRRFVPEGEEREWVDDNGVESWCVLPKLIPISWGYDLYQRIARMSDQAEREVIEGIERRRLEIERKQ